MSELTPLPWNPAREVRVLDLRNWLAKTLEREVAAHLPDSICLYVDPEVDGARLQGFLDQVARTVAREVQKWLVRGRRFVEMGLFDTEGIEHFLTSRRGAQPWVLFFSRDGGLGLATGPGAAPPEVTVITCFNLRHHGVAWRRDAEGAIESWLVTSRADGGDWDWDSDIGHELAHATFCQVPLFSLELQARASRSRLTDLVDRPEALDTGHLVRMAYHFSEIPVAALIEESRPTETNLPVEEREELQALLDIADSLMPRAGFDRAAVACRRVGGRVDTRDGDETFQIAAPIMRIMPVLSSLTRSTEAPTLEWYRSLDRGLARRVRRRRSP